MKRIWIALVAAIVLLSGTASARITDKKILVVVGNTSASLVNTSAKYVEASFARWQKTLGFEYDVYDANYMKVCSGCSTYTHHGEANKDSLDIWDIASQGDYSMAIFLNLPSFSSLFDGSPVTEYTSTGWGTSSSHFGQWIDRNSPHPFPIPVFLPLVDNITQANYLAAGVTGQVDRITRSWAATPYRGLINARGDSIYSTVYPTSLTEAIIAGNDSLSWVYPLVWRDDDASYDAVSCKPTYAWMTVGSGRHRVIYLPYAFTQNMWFLWPAIIGMFTPITPLDMPITAVNFGSSNSTWWGTSQDTISLGVNFKAIKDYAVENGMKIMLDGLTYDMVKESGADAHPIFQTTAYEYATAYPNNIRIAIASINGWGAGNYDLIGASSATTYSGVDGLVARMNNAQDSVAVYFPQISTTALNIYSCAITNKPDSVMMAFGASGITDVFNGGSGSTSLGYPASSTYNITGAQRTWVGRGESAAELRFHPQSASSWRYTIQNSNDDDTLRIAYIGTASYNDNRATVMRYLIPTMYGYYRTTVGATGIGSQGISILSTSNSYLATHGDGYNPGVTLNALTFTGGSSTKSYSASEVDSSRSLFLDMMKQINNEVRMANYIVDTYGTVKQPVFVYSWMDECKYDRRNNRTYSNNHVTK